MMYVEGLSRIRVEHASILGYLEPVSAPLYALLLLGEATTRHDRRRRRADRRRRRARGGLRLAARREAGEHGADVSAVTGHRLACGDARPAPAGCCGLRHRLGLVPDHGSDRRPGGLHDGARERTARAALRDRRAGARRGLRAPPAARRRAPAGHSGAPAPHGPGRLADAAAVLRRPARHERRHRHVPRVPRAGVGGARGAAHLQGRTEPIVYPALASPSPASPSSSRRPSRRGRQVSALGLPAGTSRVSATPPSSSSSKT